MGSNTHLPWYQDTVVLADEGSVGGRPRRHGGPIDMTESRVQFKKAADQGHMEAQYKLALMLFGGEGGPADMTEARVQYKKASDQGHVVAQYNLACMLYKGEGGPVNMAEARVHNKKAADRGNDKAQSMLA